LKQQTDPDKVKQLIGAIYRKFLKRSQPGSELNVSESLRNFIKAGLKDELILTSDIFDQMQHDVARIISETTYPNFLQSDLYLQFVQNMQQNLATGGASIHTSSSLGSSSSPSELVSHSSALPTLHEDSELETDSFAKNCLFSERADSIEQLYGAIGPGIPSRFV
jgi:axin 1